MNDKKICFIMCVNDKLYEEECIRYIQKLNVPEGYEVEQLSIWDAPSMAAGYNEGMRQSDAKYKVYLHQDVFVVYQNFIYEFLKIFSQDSKIGMVGMVGSPVLPMEGVMWAGARIGALFTSNVKEAGPALIGEVRSPYEQVEAVDGLLIATQHLGLGTIRMQEQLAKKSCSLEQYELQIEELVEKELNVFMAMFTEQVKVKNLIIIGDYIMEVAGKVTGKKHENLMETNDFLAFLDDLDKKTVEQISEELNLSNENDSLIIPYMIIFKCMARKMKAEKIWAPGVIVSDGIAYDYAQKHKLCKPVHDFDADVISAARNLSARYMSYSPHIDALTQMATLIFDTMKKIHGLGKRERLLLQVAAILHDCGKYISLANGPLCSYDIIMASEIIGLTHMEREIVAYTVLYNTYPLPAYEDFESDISRESYVVIAKLSAILRVSNAMDRSHKQKFKNVRAAVKGKELVITIETDDDIALEKALFDAKVSYFENIFSIKPVVKEKRVY